MSRLQGFLGYMNDIWLALTKPNQSPPSDLLLNISLAFTIAYYGKAC